MSLPQPDFGVLRKAQRGDERAFSIIVRAYQVPVFNYVLRLVGDRSLAEDLTQEVFLRVFQGLPRFSLRSKFTTWLFQVTKNRVLDELRAIERRPRAVVDIEDVPPLEVLDAPFERLEAIDAVWRAVENLNVDLKMALLLRDIVGLSYTEIADSLEVTLATVKWRIYKAREDVQLALAREGIHLYGEDDGEPTPRRPPSRLARVPRAATPRGRAPPAAPTAPCGIAATFVRGRGLRRPAAAGRQRRDDAGRDGDRGGDGEQHRGARRRASGRRLDLGRAERRMRRAAAASAARASSRRARAASSAADAGRSAGSAARHCMTTRARSVGASLRRRIAAVSVSSASVAGLRGGRPVSSS